MEQNKNEESNRERKRARWSITRMRRDIGRQKRARRSTTRMRRDIGREREREGAQQEGGEREGDWGDTNNDIEHNNKEG